MLFLSRSLSSKVALDRLTRAFTSEELSSDTVIPYRAAALTAAKLRVCPLMSTGLVPRLREVACVINLIKEGKPRCIHVFVSFRVLL